ncbi:endonuclease 8-like 1 isoform X3 [Mustela erminea]|nr:endonuclease 8-like 1 isoform X3 [Mustela erminea]XP_032198284.1 endonuclease 8-like 1 isoform X3 [Mustela erminea]XP_032198285.1 endonuclease 8-like 1 isoform X3 [Mustela erminea]XP_032198286.1 endonuclease 8-like 1 isoform X3 [Mustela erminea]XP_032198287.1 endonuclease 8-like 1 isoform X3 [Mustela erminea]
MPEGPELHLASLYVNEACKGLVFAGCVEKSPVSRNPEVPFESSAYCISSSARGKELRLTLSPLPGAQPPQEPLALVFRFGMSGSFQLAPRDALPAHAHLRFYTAPPGPPLALCFVDIRRFGHWDLGGEWQPGRGPCVLLEYEQFRENVLRNLADKVFDQPICEALLDQRFFNGIGNYLRAEILYRLRIPPFEKARKVLEELQQRRPSPELTLSQKIRAKLQNPDLLELCHSVPKEVVRLGGKGYGPEHGEEDFAAFRAWLQCYGVPGMSSLRDRRGRTIWFQGDPGPLAPKGGKSRKKKSKGAQQGPEHRLEDPLVPSTAPSRTRGTPRGPPGQSTAQQPEGTSLQQDPEVPPVPGKAKRRRRPATSEGLGSPTWDKLLPDLGNRRATQARPTEPLHPSSRPWLLEDCLPLQVQPLGGGVETRAPGSRGPPQFLATRIPSTAIRPCFLLLLF